MVHDNVYIRHQMATDTQDADVFYHTRLGGMISALLRRDLSTLWPDMAGLSVLGVGHAAPCFEIWQQKNNCISLSLPENPTTNWPKNRPNLACVAETESLPFADLSFDRVVMIHGLEQAENARRTLREVWRVLKDDGKLIVVTPNRRGFWAYAETTPFGHGQPYSERQLARLLNSLFFKVETQKTALYAPPLHQPFMLRLFWLAEHYGPFIAPHFAGLVIAEASKTLYGLTPAKKRRSARRVFVTDDI